MDVTQLDHGRGFASFAGAARVQAAAVEMARSSWCRKACAVLFALSLFTGGAGPATACKLAILGDSLTSGFGVAADEAFPVQLEAALAEQGVSCEVIGAGVSGDTSAGGAARVEWVLGDRPTHLLVELGGNDALRGLPVDQLRANLGQIIRTAKNRGVEVMLAGMLAPPNLGRSYGEQFKAVYTDLAREHDISLYPFFLEGAIFQDGLMQPDGIHPNARGVAAIAQRMAPLVATFLQDE